MAAVQKVCVIGGGFSGMAAAIQMRRAGLEVDLYEIDAQWCPLGAGITINGPTLRALESLGLYGEFQQRGCVTSGLDICAPTAWWWPSCPRPARWAARWEAGAASCARPWRR